MDSDPQLTSTVLSSTIKTDDSNLQTTNGQSSLSNVTELESSNLSNTTSITDATTGLSSLNLTETDVEKSRNVTRELIIKKQLLHDIQKLKIELSQKNLLIDTMKADNLNQLDDMEEKLADAIHTRQLLQAKFETQARVMKNEMEKRIAVLKKDLQESVQTQKQLQRKYDNEMNDKDKLLDFRAGYIPKELNEDEYLEVKSSHDKDLAIQDIFNVS